MSLDKGYTKDLSPAAVKTAVVKSAAQKPLVVYPVAVSAIGVLCASIFDFGLLTAIPIVGGAVVSAVLIFGMWLLMDLKVPMLILKLIAKNWRSN